jgi:hypothetical protein
MKNGTPCHLMCRFCKHSTFMCRRFQGSKFDTSSVYVSYETNCLEDGSVIVAWGPSFVSSDKFSCKQVRFALSLKRFKGRWWIYVPPDLALQYSVFRPYSVFVLRMILAMPVTVAARSKAWTVFARSNTRVVSSNHTRSMDVCVRLFCVVLCVGRGLVMGWSPVQRVLPTAYRIKKLKKRPRPNKGL